MKQVYVSPHFRDNSQKEHPKNVYKSPLLSSYTKKGLNPYFSFNDENYDTSSEVQLMKDLQYEQIRQHGLNATYIVRTNNTLDDIYGESIGSTFKHSFRLEVLAEGHAKGLAEGEKKKNLENVRKVKQLGVSVDIIIKATRLPAE